MKRTDLPANVQRLLAAVPYVTIASACPDGKPWNTPVYGFFDDDLALYWASWPNNQHSLNIKNNPCIFVVVYDSAAPEGEAVGLYLQMHAKKLTRRSDILQSRKIYTTNFGEDGTHDPFAGDCPRRLYKAITVRAWCNGEDYVRGSFIDIRRELTVKPG